MRPHIGFRKGQQSRGAGNRISPFFSFKPPKVLAFPKYKGLVFATIVPSAKISKNRLEAKSGTSKNPFSKHWLLLQAVLTFLWIVEAVGIAIIAQQFVLKLKDVRNPTSVPLIFTYLFYINLVFLGFRVESSGLRVYLGFYTSNASVLNYRSTSLLPKRGTQTHPCIFVRSTLCMLYGCLAINSENWKKTCRGNAAATHRIHIFRKGA